MSSLAYSERLMERQRPTSTAEFDLGRPPDIVGPTALDRGITLVRGWLGQGTPRLEVCEVEFAEPPNAVALRRAWDRRRKGRAVPVVILTHVDGAVRICGPEGQPPPLAELPNSLAAEVLRQALQLPPSDVVPGLLSLLQRSQGSGGVPGLRNRQLLSTHYLSEVLPRQDPATWADLVDRSKAARRSEGRGLLTALGYRIVETEPKELLLHLGDEIVAIAHIYSAGTNLDRIREHGTAPPAAALLARARARGQARALLVSGPLIRLYTTDPSEELEVSAASTAYLEIDTRILPDDHAGILAACLSAEALRAGGSFDTLAEESKRYAVELRARFRDRVYEKVVPLIVRGLATAATQAGTPVAPHELYRSTLALLFRLLFVLYAEDRNLLPLENPFYRQRSLTARLAQIQRVVEDGGRGFDKRATDIWDDLRSIFVAVRDGHTEWGIPPYDGGLFEDGGETAEGRILATVRLPNAILGPALYDLAIDRDLEGSGKVDFGDLGVRHLGTIYEGLLSYEVAVADVDLTVDPKEEGEPWVAAGSGDKVEVRAGQPYLQSPKGGRKMTGSYYTPAFVVDRLVRGAMLPTLQRHLDSLRSLSEEDAAAALFDFRVCDPAMGSGHFLVSALDLATEAMAAFLAEKRMMPVVAELDRARAQITAIGRAYGAEGLGERVSDIDLLRRLVMKRCIYGVDLNPMAVELARLGLWLHAFVPGLPLSFLGHSLREGNSLVGVAGPEINAFVEGGAMLFGSVLTAALGAALEDARAIGTIPDLELSDVEESKTRQRRLEEETHGLRQLLDLYVASCKPGMPAREDIVLHPDAARLISGAVPKEWGSATITASDFCREQRALHWQLAFPEVFVRERPGFDAILANPPWEEVTVEQLGFYTRYLPGIKSEASQTEQERRIYAYTERHPEVKERYVAECETADELRMVLRHHYHLTQSGDPDLYKAFAERFLNLCRPGGALGVVLPRSAFAADGTAPFRAALFGSSQRVTLDFLLNKGRWVFDMEPRYTVCLLVGEIGAGSPETVVSTAGPIDNRLAFTGVDEERVEWTVAELAALSDGLEVPLIPSHAAAALFHRMCTSAPPFRSADGGFRMLPWRELDMTNDRKSGLLKETGEGWPVYSGDSFDIYNPDRGAHKFVLNEKEGISHLQAKRQNSGLWKRNFLPTVLKDPKTLPQYGARILFRDVTRSTDSRTVRACVVPPRVFATNKAPSLLFPKGDQADEAYVVGVMCSVPFDWTARRRVETNLNFFILAALPFPRPDRDDPKRRRIVELSGRLACPDDRFGPFAQAIGVEYGPVDADTRRGLVAEIDALVAHLYELTRDDLEVIFQDFPATEAGVSPPRRELILSHFDRLSRTT